MAEWSKPRDQETIEAGAEAVALKPKIWKYRFYLKQGAISIAGNDDFPTTSSPKESFYNFYFLQLIFDRSQKKYKIETFYAENWTNLIVCGRLPNL